jgi:hypothetical protein
MIQEDKNLLLKDLCARLPYGFKYQVIYDNRTPQPVENVILDDDFTLFDSWQIHEIKPYLRLVSSMTDEEMDKLFDILHVDKDGNDEDWIKINDALGIKFFFPTGKWVENVAEAYDYLNSIHIDYRGLVPKGLALVAPEGMYK